MGRGERNKSEIIKIEQSDMCAFGRPGAWIYDLSESLILAQDERWRRA